MTTFRCSLFQANGQWNIVHWDEMRFYTGNAIPGYQYDETFVFLGTTVFTNNFFIGPDPQLTRPTYPLSKGTVQPYKFVRKTFNYNNPKYLLKNYDLQRVGALLRQYVSGVYTIFEYVATDWTTGIGPILCERFIRVTKDAIGNEISRELIARGNNSDSTRAVSAEPFEAELGDKIKFSFSFKTNISQSGPIVIVFAVRLTDGTLNRYVDEVPVGNGNWINTVGFSYAISGGDNSNTWHNVEIASSSIPFSGLIYCYLAIATDAPYNSSRETAYKDIRLEYFAFVNDTTKIIGQIHKENREVNVKNNTDVDIHIDDSPRNAIVGTLFLPTVTNLLQDRTWAWKYIYYPSPYYYRLNELMTQEEINWRDMLRAKYEGNFIGLYQSAIVSALMVAQITFDNNKNFVPGLLSIDYKRNSFNCTLWEVFDTSEPVLDSTYSFTYIYSTT